MTKKSRRQALITELVESREIVSQLEILADLETQGVRTTQSTLSRDLTEIGVYKMKGVYRVPRLGVFESSLVNLVSVDTAGDNLIVLKTPIGQAPLVALTVDREKLPEVVGTVAGDDAVFVAVKGRREQKRALKVILTLFRK